MPTYSATSMSFNQIAPPGREPKNKREFELNIMHYLRLERLTGSELLHLPLIEPFFTLIVNITLYSDSVMS